MLTAEVCVESVAGARAALAGGGNRLELCSALDVGGVTPSAGLIEAAAAVLPTQVLIRPRPGDFCYGRDEIAVMAADIVDAMRRGAAGVVIGALTADGDVDTEAMRRWLEAVGAGSVTFHRAFDMTRDPRAALDTLAQLGVPRLLTSGCAHTAAAGSPMLAELIRRAASNLVVMPGGGIRPNNAAAIVRETGAREIHFSARVSIPSPMTYRNPAVSMGGGAADEYARHDTSIDVIRAIITAALRANQPDGAAGEQPTYHPGD